MSWTGHKKSLVCFTCLGMENPTHTPQCYFHGRRKVKSLMRPAIPWPTTPTFIDSAALPRVLLLTSGLKKRRHVSDFAALSLYLSNVGKFSAKKLQEAINININGLSEY